MRRAYSLHLSLFGPNANSQQAALPDALSSHSAWRRFHQDLCALAAVPLAPARPAAHPPAPASGSLDDVISQAEVEKALPKLANGRAAGRAGWPAELLRYASFYVEDENGNMKKVWMLAPLLTSMLNAFFLGGSIPAYVSLGLVTPTHKKGCTLDPAWIGLRSMASAALHRLVSDLADPPSTICSLFDTSLTMPSLPSGPCTLVSWTFRRPTGPFSMTFCGAACA